jgi:hypothetical protein
MILAAGTPDLVTWADLISNLPSILLWAGGMGFMVTAYLKSWIVPRGSHDEKCRESEEWKRLYLEEVAAHAKTREAMTAAAQASAAAADQGKLVVGIIQALQQQVAHHDPAAIPAPPP